VKGQRFDLATFLGDAELARKFAGGAMLISRLCPVDYHRFHFPVAGIPGEPRLINGFLYSVSPIALRRKLDYLWQNKRMVTLMKSPVFGQLAVCEIGATMVGTIFQSFLPGRAVAKGDEKGLFKFGGSCVITLFQPGKIKFDSDLAEHGAEGLEVYARMGERLGVAG
jgi:phosphatidylserine decarboxylase